MGTIIRFYDPHKENGYLSNWFISPFTYAGKQYFSCEQYLMEQKALTFGDDEIAEKIMKSKNLSEIKKLGRQVARYNENLWKTIRPQVMRRGLRAKFQQNPELLIALLGQAMQFSRNVRRGITSGASVLAWTTRVFRKRKSGAAGTCSEEL